MRNRQGSCSDGVTLRSARKMRGALLYAAGGDPYIFPRSNPYIPVFLYFPLNKVIWETYTGLSCWYVSCSYADVISKCLITKFSWTWRARRMRCVVLSAMYLVVCCGS